MQGNSVKNNNILNSGVTFLFSLMLSFNVFAADIVLSVQDHHGKPLPNTVIEVLSEQSSQKTGAYSLAVMDQVDKQFKPTVLVVQQGQQVNFPNSDNIRHHVYSFSKAKPFQLKLYSGEPKEPLTFEQQGVVVLGCNIHDSMVGYIYVTDNQHVLKSDQHGKVTLSNLTLPAKISLWHPLQVAALEQKQQLVLPDNSSSSLQLTIATTEPAPLNTFGSKFKDTND